MHTGEPAPAAHSPLLTKTWYANYVLGALTLCYVINTMDRSQILAASLQSIKIIRNPRAVVDGVDAPSVGRFQTGHAHSCQDARVAALGDGFANGLGRALDVELTLPALVVADRKLAGVPLSDLIGNGHWLKPRQTLVAPRG